MKELLLNILKTSDLARVCDNMNIDADRETRTSRKKMMELLMKKSYKELKAAISELPK
jgi:hypothetical protein